MLRSNTQINLLLDLQKLWLKHPDLRLGQLLTILNHGGDLFNLYDNELLRLIDEWNNKDK